MNVIDLFSGCGGMSLGFQNAGYKIQEAYDNWEPAVDVYKENFDHKIVLGDLSDKNIRKNIINNNLDVIIGGPPCQDFSIAGHRDPTLGRAELTYCFSEIVNELQPEYFVMENVDRFRKSSICQQIQKLFRKVGYGLSEHIIDACFFGVPQKRKRYFLIGHKNGDDNFFSIYLDKYKYPEPMTIFEYFGESLDTEYYFRIPTSYQRRAVFSIYEPSVTIRGVDRPIPKNYKKHPKDLVEIGNRVRAFSVKERSYIQTFPQDFKFHGSKTNLNIMIGNAVPVKLAEKIALALKDYHNDHFSELINK